MSDFTKLPQSALVPPSKFRIRTAETVPALRLFNIRCFKNCGNDAMLLMDMGNGYVSSEVALCKLDARQLVKELAPVLGLPTGVELQTKRNTRALAMKIATLVDTTSRAMKGPPFATTAVVAAIQQILDEEA